MGKKAIPAKKDLLALLARAKDLPPNFLKLRIQSAFAMLDGGACPSKIRFALRIVYSASPGRPIF